MNPDPHLFRGGVCQVTGVNKKKVQIKKKTLRFMIDKQHCTQAWTNLVDLIAHGVFNLVRDIHF